MNPRALLLASALALACDVDDEQGATDAIAETDATDATDATGASDVTDATDTADDATDDATESGGDDGETGEDDEPFAGVALDGARYEMTWQKGQAEIADDGGWVVVNDLGYTITVERGAVVSYSAALVECLPRVARAIGPRLSPLERAMSWALAPGTAHAGHGGSINPTETVTPRVDPVTPPQGDAVVLGDVTFAAARYCQIHYLVARGDGWTVGEGDPDAADMQDKSALLEGHYRAPGAAEETAFVISGGSAYGKFFALDEAALAHHDASELDALSRSDAPLQVTIVFERSLDALFAGLELDALDDDARARAVIENLVEHTHVRAELRALAEGAAS